MISQMKELCIRGCVPYIIPLVYDETLTYLEILYATTAKINELINNNNQLDATIISMVNDEIQKRIDDGTFANIISEQILNDLNVKIDTNTQNISNLTTELSKTNQNVAENSNYITGLNNRVTENETSISLKMDSQSTPITVGIPVVSGSLPVNFSSEVTIGAVTIPRYTRGFITGTLRDGIFIGVASDGSIYTAFKSQQVWTSAKHYT